MVLSWPCLTMPLPLLSMRKTTFLISSFSGLRTVSPLAAAVGSIWQNLSDIVNAFKSTVTDLKGNLSKCLSLRFQAIWDSLKHWICSHDYPPSKSPEELAVLWALEFVAFFFSGYLLLYHWENLIPLHLNRMRVMCTCFIQNPSILLSICTESSARGSSPLTGFNSHTLETESMASAILLL